MTGPGARLETPIGGDGSFEFLKVRSGTYRLVASPGTLSQPVTITVSDKDVSDLELMNPRTVQVTGNVLVESGGLRPVFNVLFSPFQGGLSLAPSIPVNDAFTTALPDGNYRIGWSGLPAGYFVRSVESGSVDLLAKPLTIGEAAVPPITITLGVSSPPPWVKLSGRVTGLPRTSSGSPRVQLSSGSSLVGRLEAPIGADGSFMFPAVLPGTYTASIFPTPAVAPKNTSIYVGRTDVDNIQIVIPVTKCVPGRAVVEGDGPIPNLNFSFAELAGNAASSVSTATVFPLADGKFGILLPEGEHRMTLLPTSLPPGYSLKSFTYGSVDLLRSPLQVSSADSPLLLLTFAADPGSWANVSGRVTGIDPTARTYRVQLTAQRGLVAVVQPDGSFNFGKVLRGNHTIALTSPGGIPVSKPIVVAGQDITAFEFTAPFQKEVVGHVKTEGGDQRFISFDLVLRGSAGSVAVNVSARPDGNFKIALPEGESQVSVSGLPTGAVKSLTYGDADLLKGPLRVSRTDTAELQVTVAAGTTGRVLGGVLSYGPNACGM
jgi:hypothetical protein